MAADDVIPFNVHVPGAMHTRTRKSGSQYITTTVSSEGVAAVLSDKAIAMAIAEVIARRIREQTEAITDTVRESTAVTRRVVERAFARGESWAVRRFAGGRMGSTPPRSGENRMFNHSGRLAQSVVARFSRKADGFVINVAANRWNVAQFRSLNDMRLAFQKWVDRVPVIMAPFADLEVFRALEKSTGGILRKGRMTSAEARKQARAEARNGIGVAGISGGDIVELLQRAERFAEEEAA